MVNQLSDEYMESLYKKMKRRIDFLFGLSIATIISYFIFEFFGVLFFPFHLYHSVLVIFYVLCGYCILKSIAEFSIGIIRWNHNSPIENSIMKTYLSLLLFILSYGIVKNNINNLNQGLKSYLGIGDGINLLVQSTSYSWIDYLLEIPLFIIFNIYLGLVSILLISSFIEFLYKYCKSDLITNPFVYYVSLFPSIVILLFIDIVNIVKSNRVYLLKFILILIIFLFAYSDLWIILNMLSDYPR
jgi:hypothetical protein